MLADSEMVEFIEQNVEEIQSGGKFVNIIWRGAELKRIMTRGNSLRDAINNAWLGEGKEI